MAKEPTVEALLSRFSKEVHSTLYLFLVASIIETNGSASRQEIRDEIARLTDGIIKIEILAHHRLVGRLEKTFHLIERLGRENDPALLRYRLTKERKGGLYSEPLDMSSIRLGRSCQETDVFCVAICPDRTDHRRRAFSGDLDSRVCSHIVRR